MQNLPEINNIGSSGICKDLYQLGSKDIRRINVYGLEEQKQITSEDILKIVDGIITKKAPTPSKQLNAKEKNSMNFVKQILKLDRPTVVVGLSNSNSEIYVVKINHGKRRVIPDCLLTYNNETIVMKPLDTETLAYFIFGISLHKGIFIK